MTSKLPEACMGVALGLLWMGSASVGSCGGTSSTNGEDPVAEFSVGPAEGEVPFTLTVDASASHDPDGTVVSYHWDFADGGSATGVRAQHTYERPGSFELELRIADNRGNTDSLRRVVRAHPAPANYAGVYASDAFAATEVLLVLQSEGSMLTGTLRDAAGRTGTLTGFDWSGAVSFTVELTTLACAGVLSAQGFFTAEGLEFTFSGTDCTGAFAGGSGELLRHAGEVLAIAEPHPIELTSSAGELFWSSSSDEPLKRFTPSTGALRGLAPRCGPILGLAEDGAGILWTEILAQGIGACGSESATVALRRTEDGTQIETLDRMPSCSRDVSSDVVVAGGAAFWAQQSSTSPETFTLRRTPLDGSPAETIVTTARRIRALAVDATYLDWSEEALTGLELSHVWRLPLVGGAPEEMLATDLRPLSLAPSSAGLLVAQREWEVEGGELLLLPLDGSPASLRASFASAPRRVVSDGTTVVWLTDAEVGRLEPAPGGAVTLAQTILPGVDIALDGDRLVWIEAEQPCCAGELRAVELDGGGLALLARPSSPLRLLRAGDGSLFWTEGGQDPAADPALVRRSPVGELHTWLEGLQRAVGIAVDADHVYVAEGWWIKRVARDGGTLERFARGEFSIADVAVDQGFVYWIEHPFGTLRRRSKAGGVLETLSLGSGPPAALVVARGRALWVEGPDTIRSAPVTGGPASVFASSIDFPTHLVTDGEYAYFNSSGGLLFRKAVDGGPLGDLGSFGAGSLTNLAVDASSLHVIARLSLWRLPLAGGPLPPPLPVRNDVFEAGSVASTGDYLYWAETLLGTIGRRRLPPLP